ncbi:MAG: hypothetical protein Q8K65_05640 [Alphaproteobacteria bacterium]|nr:hypothetical protein [Alphaproteobacteria bacterium]
MKDVAGTARITFPLSVAVDAAGFESSPFSDFARNNAARHFFAALCTLVSVTEKSPAGRALIRAALIRDVSIGLDPLLEPQTSFYYPLHKRLDLGYQPEAVQNSQKGVSQYLSSFTGGLRRAWQQGRALAPDTGLKPEDFLRYCRAFEADVTAITHMVAWELRGAGPCFFWRHLLAGPDADVAAAFSRTASAHPRHQFDGTALRAAFLQWFQVAERVDASDHLALEMMDMALLAPRLTGAGIGGRPLDHRQLCLLGALPQGGNYLTGMRFRGPQMRRGCDPFNRTHLRHIQRDIEYLSENQESY